MQNIFTADLVTLIQAIEQIKAPSTYLVDTFFPNKMPVSLTTKVAVEFMKGKRKLAPYIVKGSGGITVGREIANANYYSAPMIGAKRIITVEDLEQRQFGEQPVFSQVTPAERAAELQARDLVYLQNLIYNRMNKMAADILTAGQVEIKGYADDGSTVREETIDFQFTGNKTPATLWNNNASKILEDLTAYCDEIAEESGELPDIMVCGANVEKYLLANKQLCDMLMISNRSNLTVASLNPHYTAPQARYLGYINSLGLEVYSYLEKYFDDETNQAVPFIPANSVILAKAKKGKQLFGAVTLADKNAGFQTYSTELVPRYLISEENNQTSLSMFSRCLLVPDEVSSWIHIKTCG